MKIVLVIYLAFVVFMGLVTLKDICSGIGFAKTPMDIYDLTYFNWVGAWLSYLLFIIMDPLYFIGLIIYYLVHAGRKK